MKPALVRDPRGDSGPCSARHPDRGRHHQRYFHLRTDQLAYGGVKDSGIGREGPRYAIRDMTEERMVLFNH